MRYFFVLIDLKSGKKAAILIIYISKLYKLMTSWKSPKSHLLARLATLSNEQKIKIKLLNNSASYSVNEELIDLQTVKTMQYSPPRYSPQPIILYAT